MNRITYCVKSADLDVNVSRDFSAELIVSISSSLFEFHFLKLNPPLDMMSFEFL